MSESSAPSSSTASLTAAHRYDQGILLAGVLALIGSVLPFYTISVDIMGVSNSDSASAWNGFFGWFGVVAAVAGSTVLLLHLLGQDPRVPVRLTVLVAYGVAVICTLIAMFVVPGGGCDELEMMGTDLCEGIDFGRGFGFWLTLLAVVGGLALAVLRRDTSAATDSPESPAPPAPTA